MNNTQKKQKNKTTITFTNKELNVIYEALTEFENMIDSNNIVNRMKDIPIDCKDIVLEHHEKPKKMGFPNNKDEHSIGPLSCIFIIAQELAHYILIREKTNSEEFQRFIFKLKTDYSKGNFKDQISALDKVFHLKK